MEEPVSGNMQKYENYKEQFGRLKKALNQGFYLEAMFIEYAILEDRAESVLRHTGKWDSYLKSRKGHPVSLPTKLKYIEKTAEQKSSLVHQYFSDTLFEEINVWKDERNRLIHALLKQSLEHGEIRKLALQGQDLVNRMRRQTNQLNRTIARRQKPGLQLKEEQK